MTKQKLQYLRNPNCRLCSLHQSSDNVCIFGRGTLEPRIVLIGEAPGAAESETGKPFMGRSGQFLNKVLNDLNLSDIVYISNAVKCRPPGNRKPTNREIDVCRRTYLVKELKILKPELVVALGVTATHALIGTRGFVRGSVYRSKVGFIVMPTYHPAYCLRAGRIITHEFIKHLESASDLVV